MSFIRVKSTKTGHEFDVNPEHAAKRDDWKVIDDTPVDRPRPAKHSKTAPKPAASASDIAETEVAPVASTSVVNDDRLSKSSAK